MSELNKSVQRILLIDDDVDDCEIFTQAIAELSLKMQVDCCPDNHDVLVKLEQSLPQLIFLNLHLPHHSGVDTLKEIQAHASFSMIPVLIYTSWPNKPEISAAIAAGAKLYVEKPASYNELVNHLRAVLSLPWHQAGIISAMHFFKDGINKRA